MFIIVVYDIMDNKRRTKDVQSDENFGTPIQFSAFECILNEKGSGNPGSYPEDCQS